MSRVYCVIFATVLLAGAALAAAGPEPEESSTLASPENPCASRFKEDPKRIAVSEHCVNESKLTMDDTLHSEEEFVKSYDDKVRSN